MQSDDFTITGNVGDAFIRINRDGHVELIFGEDEVSLTRDMEWDEHEIYKAATQFALMIDSYIRNTKALNDLILNSTTGSIPAELLGKDLLPITLAGAGIVDEEVEVNFKPDFDMDEEPPTSITKDNVIQFKQRKNDEDK